MRTIIFLTIPTFILLGGVVAGMRGQFRCKRFLVWASSVGLALFHGGFIVMIVGKYIHRGIYCEQLAMGPIEEKGFLLFILGMLCVAFIVLLATWKLFVWLIQRLGWLVRTIKK